MSGGYEPIFDMPEAPEAPARRGFASEINMKGLIQKGTSFALFAVSILLVVWAFGILEKGLLVVYDPNLAERHSQFKELSGFDNVTTSGAGVDLCIVDTGIDLHHPDLAHVELAGWIDFINDRADPYDDQGHGTAMAGILVAKNLLRGIAPNVNLHIAKAIEKTGSGTDTDIAAAVGTPFYCYSATSIEYHFKALKKALAGLNATICYAVKANSNIAIIKTLSDMGAGADVVSSGELTRALKAGVPPKKIVFSGVGKTTDELTHALKEDILQINIESEPELDALNKIANSLDQEAQVALRINPDIDAYTHNKISTGRSEDKFGIEWTRINDVISRANKLDNIKIILRRS